MGAVANYPGKSLLTKKAWRRKSYDMGQIRCDHTHPLSILSLDSLRYRASPSKENYHRYEFLSSTKFLANSSYKNNNLSYSKKEYPCA
jgi:hypothetical protein